jgi:hypothetical protein
VDIHVPSERTSPSDQLLSGAPLVLSRSLTASAQHYMFDGDFRTSARVGTPPLLCMRDLYPFALPYGWGILTPLAIS